MLLRTLYLEKYDDCMVAVVDSVVEDLLRIVEQCTWDKRNPLFQLVAIK